MHSNYRSHDQSYMNNNFQSRGRSRGNNPRGHWQRGSGNRGGHFNRPQRGRGFQPNGAQTQYNYDSQYQQQETITYNDSQNDYQVEQRNYSYDQEYDQSQSSAYEQVPEYTESCHTQGAEEDYQWNQDADETADYHQYTETASGEMDQSQGDFEPHESYQPPGNEMSTQHQETTTESKPAEQTSSVQSDTFVQQTKTQQEKEEDKKQELEEEEDDSEEEDTGFCKYCNIKFPSDKAYYAHTRGIQHTTLVMEAKAKKGDKRFQKEVVAPEVLETKIPPPAVQEKKESNERSVAAAAAATAAATNNQEAQQEDEESSDDEDTGFCKYCQMKFASAKGYHAHTRGIQHTTLVMEAKAKKGDKRFQKEIVAPEVLEVKMPPPKPTEPTEPYVDEEMLNFDSGVADYMKFREKPENVDLDFDQLGRKADKFHCPLCEINCTGAIAFKSHIEGKSHKSKLQLAENGAIFHKKKVADKVTVVSQGRPSKLDELLKDNKVPILGLNYITEIQQTDFHQLSRYVCNLCEAKMDQYAIVNHLIGTKHRLKYMKTEKPDIYDHLTKYNSKRKKSEINAACEEFAQEVENELGRGEIKIKIQMVEDEEGKAELEDSMQRAARDLREKVHHFKNKDTEDESAPKRPRFSRDQREAEDWRWRPDPWGPPGPEWDRGRPWERDPYWEERERERAFYRGRDPWDPYRRWPEYDRMDDRRLFDERHHLESQMMDRYRLEDPYLERRRLDDIQARQAHLDMLEKERISRVEERRRHMEENDPDMLRIKRWELRQGHVSKPETTAQDKDAANYRPSFEEIQARRRQRTEIAEKLLERPRVDSTLYADSWKARQSSQQSSIPPTEESLAQRVLASKAVQEEAAKNPGVNVSDLLDKLSSSMIASEDEAAMALQISSALTNALLSYRLQKAPNLINSSSDPPRQSPSIPGLEGATSQSNLPSFLKTPGQTGYDTQAGYYGAQTGLSAIQTGYSEPEPVTSYPAAQTGRSALQANYNAPGYSAAPQTDIPIHNLPNNPDLYKSLSQAVSFAQGNFSSYGTATSQTGSHVSAAPPVTPSAVSVHTMTATESAIASVSVSNLVKNTEQPQKQILESIRKQTELLKKKIQLATGGRPDALTSPVASSPSPVGNIPLPNTSTPSGQARHKSRNYRK